jgi:hypothetical protein
MLKLRPQQGPLQDLDHQHLDPALMGTDLLLSRSKHLDAENQARCSSCSAISQQQQAQACPPPLPIPLAIPVWETQAQPPSPSGRLKLRLGDSSSTPIEKTAYKTRKLGNATVLTLSKICRTICLIKQCIINCRYNMHFMMLNSNQTLAISIAQQ